MPGLVPVRRALLSVSDKRDLVPFARSLAERGVELVSTGGTARALLEAGLRVLSVESVTGFPEMMDGRVKTLHPSVHGAILARRDLADHRAAMDEHGIVPIDLVCVSLYPFERTVSEGPVSDEAAIEQIDIGGPAMIRSAAKNHAFVAVVTDPSQYDRVIAELDEHDGATTPGLRRDFAAAAFMRTAAYDTAIASWMQETRPEPFPELLRLSYALRSDLRYGENPHQRAALYASPASFGASVVNARHVCGKPLSYNNLADAAAALELVRDLHLVLGGREHAAAAIIKHTNPCGAAVAPTAAEAFDAAWAGDPVAAYGGILALSRPIDLALAERIAEGQRFLEVVLAPEIDEDAVERLAARWKNVRLLAVGALSRDVRDAIAYRTIPGGLLAQERDRELADPSAWRLGAGPAPDEATRRSLLFAWTVAKHLSSNAIAIARGTALAGAGAGQVDRVTSCRIAVAKAGERLSAAGAPVVAASDAFFPFADGPAVLLDAGVRALVHPGGSVRDQDTFDLCAQRDATCMVTGVRHFRH